MKTLLRTTSILSLATPITVAADFNALVSLPRRQGHE